MDSFSSKQNPFGIRLGFTTPRQKTTGFSNRMPNDPITQEICTEPEGHLISFAPTGSGKTWTLAIPTLLDYPGSVVAFDPKGELTKATAGARQAMGQDVIILDPFGITGLDAESLNPTDLVLGKEPTLEDAQSLAASVINKVSDLDPFWDMSARNLVAQLLLYTQYDSPRALRNLHEVNYLLNQSLKDFGLTIRDMARSKNNLVSSGAHSLPTQADRTVACILASARSHTEVFRGEAVRKATSATSFPLEKLNGDNGVTVYLVLPPVYLRSHSALVRVWMEALIGRRVRQANEVKIETLFLIDEAAQLGPMDFLLTSVTLLRSYGVKCWTFWQDPQQLQACYPHDWQTLFNNCRYHTVFGRQSFLAEEAFAPLYGTVETGLKQSGYFVELGETPRALIRPNVDSVAERVRSQPQLKVERKKSKPSKTNATLSKLLKEVPDRPDPDGGACVDPIPF
ncbi:type IV secretory system conjugative DNA transfer family protein [Ruegeria sp. HKCCD6228]|uniref:type IV secretory system conjugative DNA transfer family protein n=1 Tax=Ruegeria sp. HKCCD6228 TaxID=2683001 RepID=UPI001492BD5B|nr:type IV secretory system conjugative DNA transfer family protein [Ruegeria sp. HKCCD6228]NOD97159.1 type IV secretory system conjugative DNA transfer family protein [Ruegeria sp. HKCCD6228]